MCFGVIWGPQSHTYTSYSNTRNGLPMLLEIHVHVWACLPTQVAIQTEGCSWRMQYMCKVPFGSHSIMPSHCIINLLLIHHYKIPCLSRVIHIKLNNTSLVLSLEFKLKPRQLVSTHSALQLAAEHKAEYTDRWKIRAQHSHIIQTRSADQTFSSASLLVFDPGHKSAGRWGTSPL